MPSKSKDQGSPKEFWALMKQNRHGLVGFGLSLLQVLVHGTWLGFVTYLAGSGQAEKLGSSDWQMWVISILMIIGAVLTMISLFLCLYGSIHGRPKILALIGLCISFFIGASTTFILILNMLAPAA